MAILEHSAPASAREDAAPVPTRSRQRPRLTLRRVVLQLFLAAGALAMVYPIIWMAASSLKPENEIFRSATLLPEIWQWQNYIDGWNGLREPFEVFYLNSFIISALAVVGNLLSCSLAAYAFARLDFRFRTLWFAVMLGTIMLPYHATLIPQYALYFELGWVNTYLPLTVPKFLATDAFFIFLFVQFIRGIPRELDQAAKVDGAGPFRTYALIIFPLLRPALVTGAIFTTIWTYNDFFSQLVYISDTARYTVPLALRMFLDTTGESSWGPMFAMSTLSLLPLIIVFVLFQRQIVEGISTTGLKG
ncbi:carbohydrate ABC transporter permease [Bogoriella caseilytica]|uniref:Carbohydrate ABC transporter membrane protein 2 (CUT1 family) n=1 Tax=Bogoriella caseilytica TaxID=56055 RepID=A0A3N2BE02_9MICO|nr:carbohydrate ABC transporter permease [Bogoriella caseilytica]ROR73455.1 carbohydrate ABC transporter membrane protein 2 (CUT1 family) [Bogoriella caseilytica]